MKLRLATWNVNSARLRMPQIIRFLEEYKPEVLCLQEIKCLNEQFPLEDLAKIGYGHVALNGQKAYHGVATVSRIAFAAQESLVFGGIDEARHINVTLQGVQRRGADLQVHNFYVPAGGDVPDARENPKFAHKLDFLSDMGRHFGQCKKQDQPMVLVGDLNVAPHENDVWSHKQMLKIISHTPIEVAHLQEVISSHDWIDVMRLHVAEDEKLFTWWSYRARDWRASNRGRRLDHIWLTPKLAGCNCHMQVADNVRSWQRPSDHAPVIMDLEV